MTMTEPEEDRSERIAAAIAGLLPVLDSRPEVGRDTDHSVTTIVDGLHCISSEGVWTLETDLSKGVGGDATAPTPGVLGRAALGSCLAMGYTMRAAVLGVPITSLRVTVDADSDVRGMLLLDAQVPPGYTEVRVHVDIESPAPKADVRQVLDEGARIDPYLDVFTRAQAVVVTDTISGSAD